MAAFQEAGHDTQALAWDDPSVNWHEWDAVLIRSTWDYPLRSQEFLDWLTRIAETTRVINSPEIIRSNLHKSYLLELHGQGIPTVPTQIFTPNQTDQLQDAIPHLDSDRFVLKPAIGAGSFKTQVFHANQSLEALEFVREHMPNEDFLLQPYLESVESAGERALVFINGEITHKVIKQPRFIGQNESVSESLPPTSEEIKLANQVLAGYKDLLYARVDVFLNDGQEMLVSEVELIEPSLFLKQNPSAIAKLVNGASEIALAQLTS
ncbi:hypothetical protein QM565_28695 [Geitlerinema splendidum]|nr:hypothetical protein [Geitlerinema splendidum]